MSQYPSPSSGAPTEPYYSPQSTEDESSWGSSSNSAPPALRAGAASDMFMGASTPNGYTHDPSVVEDKGFYATTQGTTPGLIYDDYRSVDSLGSLWPPSIAQDSSLLPASGINDDQTLGNFDISTAMSDPDYFGRIAALTQAVAQDVESPSSLQSTGLSHVDFSYHGPATTTKVSSRNLAKNHQHKAGRNDDASDGADFSSGASIKTADAVAEHGGLQQAYIRDSAEKSLKTVPESPSSLQETPRVSSPPSIEERAIANPRKPRGKKSASKTSNAEHISVFMEPDATYDFAVIDKDDVFLDPKPVAEFGKHEPHLVKKVSDAARDLKKQGEQEMQASSTPGHQQVLWYPPRNDYSVPTTPAHYKVCFDLLVKAIDYSGEDVVEKRDTKEFRRRWIDREHYDPEFVQVLAKQVLDTMIDVHQNGWTYYVQDPAFRQMYQKTMYFTFRDRFNVTALVLKYSKTTCDGILKGQRLYDVIGNSYHLETRVTSNKKANSDRAIRLAKIKKEEEDEAAGQMRTKRARDAEEDEEPNNETEAPEKPNKRTKVNSGTRLSAEATNTAPAELMAQSSADAVAQVRTGASQSRSRATTATSVGHGSAGTSKKRSKNVATSKSPVLDDGSAWSESAGVTLGGGAHDSRTADRSVQDSEDAPPRRKNAKRVFSQVHEEDEGEPVARSAKRGKSSSRAIAPVKKRRVKAHAKTTATDRARNEGNGSDDEAQPRDRGKGVVDPASSSRPKRPATRSRKPADSSAE